MHHNEDLCGPLIPIRNERLLNDAIQTTLTYNCGRNPQGSLTEDWNWDYDDSDYCDPLEDTQLGNDCSSDIMSFDDDDDDFITIQDHPDYQDCIADPSTCTYLCAPSSPQELGSGISVRPPLLWSRRTVGREA